jgi:MFS family permease
LFAFIAILVWTIYVMILLASSGNEETISQQRNNFAWGIVGMILVSLAVGLGEVFTPLSNGQDIIDQPGAQRTFQKIVAFLQMAITIISIIIIFFAGFLFVRSQGDEDSINSAKKYLAWSFIGIIVAVVSVPLVNNVFYPSDETLGDAEIKELANEAGGLLRFFLTFLGVGAMATLVIAGFFYITSFGDDERQEKAKNIIIGSIVGIIVILSAYPIVALFVPNL